MTMTVYRFDDVGAPAMNDTAGAYIDVLDKCLVTGYGAQSPAGWSKPFTGTAKAVFRMGGGTQRYLRVDNNTGNQYPKLRGYAAMTDVDTGSGDFPSLAQVATGLYGVSSESMIGPDRPWILAADDKRFHLWVGYNNLTTDGFTSYSAKPWVFFGDIIPHKTDDIGHCMLIAGTGTSGTGVNYMGTSIYNTGSLLSGHYLATAVDQVTASLQCSKVTDVRGPNSSGTATVGVSGCPYPDPVSGGLLLAPIWVLNPSDRATRGRLPGVWAPLHNLPGASGDIFQGNAAGGLSGREFMLLDAANNTTRARLALEISDTWG